MTLQRVLLLAVALVIAGGTALYARNWVAAERAQVRQEETPRPAGTFVLVAAHSLPAGTFVKVEHLRWQAWPDSGLADGYVIKGRRPLQDFVGAVVRTAVTAGQPLDDSRVVHPGDRGFLAAVLAPGMRAISVPVNATTGISGFVVPGDLVDVVLTTRVRDGDKGEDGRQVGLTLLGGLRVLAVDQKLDGEKGKAAVAKTATIEVTPKQAEQIALALKMGDLSLSLRALSRVDGSEDDGVSDSRRELTRSVTVDSEIVSLRRRHPPAGEVRVNVLRGGKAEVAAF